MLPPPFACSSTSLDVVSSQPVPGPRLTPGPAGRAWKWIRIDGRCAGSGVGVACDIDVRIESAPGFANQCVEPSATRAKPKGVITRTQPAEFLLCGLMRTQILQFMLFSHENFMKDTKIFSMASRDSLNQNSALSLCLSYKRGPILSLISRVDFADRAHSSLRNRRPL